MSWGPSQGGPSPGEMDWVCSLCKEQNYPKVTVCFKCKTGRTAGAREVAPRVFGKPPSVGTTLEGMVKSYNKKGFGFIMCLGGYTQDIFFTRENVSSRLLHPDMPGEQVSFEVAREAGKLVAKNVRALGEEIRMGERFGQYGGMKGKGRGGPEEDGSWICPMCKEHNFSRRSECFKCKMPKPGGFQPEVQQAAATPRIPGQPRFAFSDGPPPAGAGAAAPSAPQRNVSPHAGARAIREQLLRQRGEANAQGAPGSPSSSSGKGESKKRKKSSSSASSSESSKKKKKDKKKKKKKKSKKQKRSSSSSPESSRSKSSSIELEVPASSGASASASAAVQPEIEKAKSEAIAKLQELKAIEPKEERMKRFRALLREWHPDKNLERMEVAKEVFQFLQKGKALME